MFVDSFRAGSGWNWFHPDPAAWMWPCLAFGCLQLSGNVSDKFISHVMKTFKLLKENGFENSLRFLQ
jgi:hypothetical protein